MLCLVVEYSGEDVDFPPFTRAHPGSTVDLLVEPGPAEGSERSMLALLRGAPWQATDAFLKQLARSRGPVETLRRQPKSSLWFGRVRFKPSQLSAPSAKALVAVSDLIGPPWVHVEHGVVHLRSRLKDPAQAEEVLRLVQDSLRAAGVDAQVAVQEVSPKDHSVWESVVQHGIGLNL